MATGHSGAASRVTPAQVADLLRADRAATRRTCAWFALALALVAAFSLCQGVSEPGLLYSPTDVLGCYAGWLKLNVGVLFDPSLSLEKSAILAAYPMYYEVTTRFVYTLVTVVCGALLALSGTLYQTAFRNPIAAPAMLGVSSGTSAGLVLLVYVFGTQAAYMTSQRYLYCFAGGLAVLVLVMGLGRLAGGKRGFDLVDMLLVGTIVSSLLGTLTSYVTNYLFDYSQWLAYYTVSNVTDLDASGITLAVLAVATLVSVGPIVVFRFRLNGISFSDEEMQSLGIRPTGMRVLAIACGSLMILTAQMLCGAVSMVSLVVPFVSRATFGAEFRRQFKGNLLIGALVLLAARDIASLIPFVGVGIPVGTVVSVIMLPAFAWVMSTAQRTWRQ